VQRVDANAAETRTDRRCANGLRTFAIFDTFSDNAGREAHLAGEVAAALTEHAPELLAQPPSIERVDVLAEKGGG
jgi:quinol monooxygenase YgiN